MSPPLTPPAHPRRTQRTGDNNDRGNAALESIGALIFVATLIGIVAAMNPGNMVHDYTRDAVCLVRGESCDGESWIELDDTDPPIRRPVTNSDLSGLPDGHVANEDNRQLGKEMAAERGWTGKEWECLDNLWQRESGWDHNALNDSSGATGIPQLLPSAGHTLPSDWSKPAVQIEWGLNYIATRPNYGTPCAAWEFWQNPEGSPAGASTHWY